MKQILVLNAGSSSHKLCLYALGEALPEEAPLPVWQAQVDWYPHQAIVDIKTAAGQSLQWSLRISSEVSSKVSSQLSSQQAILSQVLNTLWQGPTQVLSALADIDVVGHRVVHGGQTYQTSTLITPAVKAEIARLKQLAPNHNPVNLAGIELMETLLDNSPQIAVFDTAFHSQMPDVAAFYPGPYDWVEQGIRRYGFHGISHRYCSQRAAQILGRDDLRLVVCHLGNGGSLCAVDCGQSVDTTMGFTPLDGLMMGTRSGAVDPGILIYLGRQGYGAEQLDQLLNKDSGLKGISGVSHDLRQIKQAMDAGNPRANLAYGMYLHRLKAYVGSMLMGLGGIDAIAFTAGIGEHDAATRAAVCEAMGFLGLTLDHHKNENNPIDQDIATIDSTVRVLVIHTQEDWAIAQDCWQWGQANGNVRGL